ncbi:MAG: murein biosynthesis integral membrane protein MurJ [Gudongella sp.]|nr:murein biosynthesis integral membrane protein MurJ [Gudongella sp.]
MMSFDTIKKQTKDLVTFGLWARLLNFLKGILIAFFIGANFRVDTYIVAFSATIFIIAILSEALVVSLVPLYQQIDKRDGERGRFEFTHNLISFWSIIGFTLLILSYILTPIIVRIFAPGFSVLELQKSIRLFRYGAPIILAYIYKAIFGGYLQSQHLFRAGAKGGVANAIVYIVYLVFFSRRFGLEGLMIAGVIAVSVQAYILAEPIFANQGYRYKPYILLKDRSLIRLNSFLLPIVIGVGINQINLAVDNAIASFLIEGTISELNYADEIIHLFIGVIVIALVTAIFPVISEKDIRFHEEELKHSIRYSIELILIVSIPATILILTMAEPIVRVFYERGEFGVAATLATAKFLIYFAIGIIGSSLLLLITRIYYANEYTNKPIFVAFLSLVLNIVFNIILVFAMGASGIALGTSLSVLIASFYGIYDLEKKIHFIKLAGMGKVGFRFLIASGAMIGIISLIKIIFIPLIGHLFIGNLITVISAVLLGGGAFFIILFKIKTKMEML